VIWITFSYRSRQYCWDVETDVPITPKFCPICGQNSIERVTEREVLNLYRCGEGHFFIFDTDKEPQRNPSET
jgi:predicted RNA-binding Zn-ribbon protein involved in translation (DUF1610 family)